MTLNIEMQKDSDLADIEALLDSAFGVDRYTKAAYRLREGVAAESGLSFIIRAEGALLATLRFWAVDIAHTPALLLGPIAVRASRQGQGCGIRLMEHGLKIAQSLGHKIVILVGDEAYYRRVGFSHALAQGLTMAGQGDISRILARELVPGALNNISGRIVSKK